jgi:hypothetical protein
MKRIVVLVLAAVGAVTLAVCVGVAAVLLVIQYRAHHRQPDDLTLVLGRVDLEGSATIREVVHSYNSGALSMDGDRVDAYCLRLDRELHDLDQRNQGKGTWQRGPLGDPLVLRALQTAVLFTRDDAPWFPDTAVLNSSRFFLSFPQITAHHQEVESVDLTAYDTESHLLYHAEIRW